MSEPTATRPSRRQLRLDREAKLRAEATQGLPCETVEFAAVGSATAHVPDPAPWQSASRRQSASSSWIDRVRARMTVPTAGAAALGLVVASTTASGVIFAGPNSASAVQGVSLLAATSIVTPEPAVPDSLKKMSGAADSARYRSFERVFSGKAAQCGVRSSANSLVSAFAADENLVVHPMAKGTFRVTSPFGWRSDPFTGLSSFHLGVDYAGPIGTPIYAMADGEVIYAGEGIEGRSSNVVVVSHEINGEKYSTWYVHMYADGVYVKKGEKVRAGQLIAGVGSEGHSTGPHLHFEVHKGHELYGVKQEDILDPEVALVDLGAIDVSELC